jgi:hypothetical protein
VKVTIPAAAAGATTNTKFPPARQQQRLTKVEYRPVTALTGAATNFRRHQLFNRGQDPPGSATKLLAQLDYSAATVVAGAGEARDTPLQFASQPAGNAVHIINEGDVMELVSSPVGSGLADPGGQLITTEADV